MFTSVVCTLFITTILNFFPGSKGNTNETEKFEEAYRMAHGTLEDFFILYEACVSSTMASQHFVVDDLQSYLFYPAKTTVGYAPKFTSNRRFFANLIGTPQFHHMIEKDLQQMKASFVEKLKFCDKIVMDEEMLKDMYDRAYETAII